MKLTRVTPQFILCFVSINVSFSYKYVIYLNNKVVKNILFISWKHFHDHFFRLYILRMAFTFFENEFLFDLIYLGLQQMIQMFVSVNVY